MLAKLSVRSYGERDEDAWLHIMNESLKECPGYEPRALADFLGWKKSRHFDEKAYSLPNLAKDLSEPLWLCLSSILDKRRDG